MFTQGKIKENTSKTYLNKMVNNWFVSWYEQWGAGQPHKTLPDCLNGLLQLSLGHVIEPDCQIHFNHDRMHF